MDNIISYIFEPISEPNIMVDFLKICIAFDGVTPKKPPKIPDFPKIISVIKPLYLG